MQKKKTLYILLICMLMFITVPTATWASTTKTIKKMVIIETSKGTVKKTVNSGGYITLPADVDGNGYTFLGWSTIKKQYNNPMYQAYEKIKVTQNMHLYPVKYKWNLEPDIDVNGLADNAGRYNKIIFVGDSRTVMLKNTLKRQCDSSLFDKVKFVCKSGEGLTWMKTYGEKLLFDEIKSEDAGTVAVIFNLGVNDLIHKSGKIMDYDSVASGYASYMNRLSGKLKNRNCELFYMSVNPCNTAMKPTRKESEIRGFNKKLKQRLNSNYKWINSYSYLMTCGYTFNCDFRGYTDDGVHYSMKTYKRIYAYAIKKIR